MKATTLIAHSHITKNPKISGGVPIILGTRIRAIDIIIEYDRLGMTPDEIVDAHPHLTLEAIHDVLSYYYENRESFDKNIRKRKEYIKDLSQRYLPKLKAAIG